MTNSNEAEEILDIINCSEWWFEVITHKVYTCPIEGSSYQHKNCKYFGLYRNKSVMAIGEIEAIIDVYSESKTEIYWINESQNTKDYITRAIEKAILLRSERLPQRIFLLGALAKTDFIKDSKGGMFGSKIYLNVKDLGVINSKELAVKLNGKKWSDFGL